MEHQSNLPEVRGAQGLGAYVLGAVLPAVVINPAASKSDLLYWARAELGSLARWLDALGTERAGVQLSAEELGLMVTDRLLPMLQGIDAAFERGGAEPWQAP